MSLPAGAGVERRARPRRAAPSGRRLLTPQGKWLADFFILADGERLLLDCERAQIADAAAAPLPLPPALQGRAARRSDGARRPRRLGRQRRNAAAIAAPDPRLPEAGWRILHDGPLPANGDGRGLGSASAGARPARRLARSGGGEDGAAGGRVRRAERGLLDQGLLHGPGADGAHQVSGLGQAPPGAGGRCEGRCRRRGRRCCPGRPKSAGCARAGIGRGLALLRVEALAGPLACGAATLAPRVPDWMALPQPAI